MVPKETSLTIDDHLQWLVSEQNIFKDCFSNIFFGLDDERNANRLKRWRRVS
jgi:hypothetical protein